MAVETTKIDIERSLNKLNKTLFQIMYRYICLK